MALKKHSYKIQSSIACFHFANREFLMMCQEYSWQRLSSVQQPLVRNEREYKQLTEAMRFSCIASHIEVLKQGFFEYRTNLKEKFQILEELGFFLNNLRNAFNHTTGELIPKFSTIKSKEKFEIRIPVKQLSSGYKMFDESSDQCMLFKMKIYNGKKIIVNDEFINNIYRLSMHVLAITKKQKLNTLIAYLDKNQAAKLI